MSSATRLLLALAVAVTACGGNQLGTGLAACDLEFSEVGTATIMQAQAVPSAAWGPCIEDLAPGWELHNDPPRRGAAGFTIDSDRVGIGFLRVELTDACEPAPTARNGSPPNDEIQRLVEERQATAPLPITVVATASRHVDAAFAIAKDLVGSRIEGHRVSVHTSSGNDPATAVTGALADGRFVLVVDDQTLTRGVLELRSPDEPSVVRNDDLHELLEVIVATAGPPTYDATWWHVGPGGCTVFEFDARGPGAESIASRVATAIGFYPLDELRLHAADRGLVYGELP